MPSSSETHPQAHVSGPEELLQDLPRDDHPVDLVGSLIDLGDLLADVAGMRGSRRLWSAHPSVMRRSHKRLGTARR
jgi:hypothetical protein